MNRFVLGTVAIATLGILATTGCKASFSGDGHTGSVTVNNGSSGAIQNTNGSSGSGQNPGAVLGSGSPTGRELAPPGPARCHSSGLHVKLTGFDAGAGQRYARLVFTNVSGHSCRAYGWPGLGLGNSSEGFGTTVTRDGSATSFVIPAGGHAYTRLHWTAVPAVDEPGAQCQPNPTVLSVIPPNETAPIVSTWSGGPVCQHNHISTTPLAPGTGA